MDAKSQNLKFAAAMPLLLLAGAATAQTADTASAADIVVTAQKREGTIQDVPLSVTVLGGDTLQQRGITNFQQFATLVPNLSFSYASDSVGRSQSIALRGVFGNGTTGVYLDETPLPTSIDPRIVDLERIEVLRGPQGTLYGARSMGGTVRFLTSQPDGSEFKGTAHAGGSFTKEGGFNSTLDAAVNLPIAGEALAVRATAFRDQDEGVFDRVPSADAPIAFSERKNVDSIRKWGGSVAVRGELADGRVVITPRILLQRTDYDGRPYADIRPSNFKHNRLADVQEPGTDAYELYSLTASFDTGKGTITSATSQFNRRTTDAEDITEFGPLFFGIPTLPAPTAATINNRNRLDAFSQEVRFSSAFEGPLQLTAGFFYQRQYGRSTIPATAYPGFFDNIYSNDRTQIVTEYALFAEGEFKITETLTAIAGLRWFDNTVDTTSVQGGLVLVPGTFGGVAKEKGVNPKFGLRFEPSPDLTLYATAAKGFRIGGVNTYSQSLCEADLVGLGLDPDATVAYDSDSLWSYEIGAKAAVADRRIRLGGAVFQIDWDNVQQIIGLSGCGFTAAVNAGRARNRGFEVEAAGTIVDGVNINLGAGYTDAKIVDGGVVATIPDGSRVQQVPYWTLNAGIDWDFEVAAIPAFLNADYSYTGSSISLFNDPVNPRGRPASSLVNLRLGARFGSIEASMFARNLFNEHVNYSDVPPLGPELPGRPRIATNRPRTLGIDLRANF